MAETYIIGHIEEKLEGYDVDQSRLAARRCAARRHTSATWVSYEAPNGELKVKVLAGAAPVGLRCR